MSLWFQNACTAGNIEYIKQRELTHIDEFKPTLGITLGISHNHDNIITYFSEKFGDDIDWVQCAEDIGRYDKWHLLDQALSYISSTRNFWNYILYGAVSGRKLDKIDYIINQGADNYFAFYGACKGNHLDLVKEYEEYGRVDYGAGVILASQHLETTIVSYILNKYKYSFNISISDLNISLGIACEKNNITLVGILMKFGADDYNIGLSKCCEISKCMARFMKACGASYCTTCKSTHDEK